MSAVPSARCTDLHVCTWWFPCSAAFWSGGLTSSLHFSLHPSLCTWYNCSQRSSERCVLKNTQREKEIFPEGATLYMTYKEASHRGQRLPAHSPSFPGGHWHAYGPLLLSVPTHCMSPGHLISTHTSDEAEQLPSERNRRNYQCKTGSGVLLARITLDVIDHKHFFFFWRTSLI